MFIFFYHIESVYSLICCSNGSFSSFRVTQRFSATLNESFIVSKHLSLWFNWIFSVKKISVFLICIVKYIKHI